MTDEQQCGHMPEVPALGSDLSEKNIGRRAFLGLMGAGALALMLGPEIYSRLTPAPLASAEMPHDIPQWARTHQSVNLRVSAASCSGVRKASGPQAS
jgi:hypothetical protein